jgi:tRNA (Thr-GGU) A37 N-methylase
MHWLAQTACRPNGIGLSIVELIGRNGNVLLLDGVDILDGTPLLDIKPYSAKFDCLETSRNGWAGRGQRGHGATPLPPGV